jgi:hypothetical protein
LLGPHLALMNDTLIKFTPDLALLFAIGVLTSGILTASERVRSRPWAWYALAASSPVVPEPSGHRFWATTANLRTRPLPNQSLHSSWAVINSSNACGPIWRAMSVESARNACSSAVAVA